MLQVRENEISLRKWQHLIFARRWWWIPTE